MNAWLIGIGLYILFLIGILIFIRIAKTRDIEDYKHDKE